MSHIRQLLVSSIYGLWLYKYSAQQSLCLTVCAAFYVHTLRVAIRTRLHVHSRLLHWLLARTLIAGVSSLSFQLHSESLCRLSCTSYELRALIALTCAYMNAIMMGAFTCGVLILVWVLKNGTWRL